METSEEVTDQTTNDPTASSLHCTISQAGTSDTEKPDATKLNIQDKATAQNCETQSYTSIISNLLLSKYSNAKYYSDYLWKTSNKTHFGNSTNCLENKEDYEDSNSKSPETSTIINSNQSNTRCKLHSRSAAFEAARTKFTMLTKDAKSPKDNQDQTYDKTRSHDEEVNGNGSDPATSSSNPESELSDNIKVNGERCPAVLINGTKEEIVDENELDGQKPNVVLPQFPYVDYSAKEAIAIEESFGKTINKDVLNEVELGNTGNTANSLLKQYGTATSGNSGSCSQQTLQPSHLTSDNDTAAVLEILKRNVYMIPPNGLQNFAKNSKNEDTENKQICLLALNRNDAEKYFKDTSSTKNVKEIEAYKHFVDHINRLHSEILQLKESGDYYKFLYLQVITENTYIRNTIEALYQELEKSKTLSTTSSPFWSVISGRRKSDQDITLNYVQNFCDYIKMLHTDQNNQEAAIKLKTDSINNLQTQLQEANKKNSDLDHRFEHKVAEQTKIIKEQDAELKRLKKLAIEVQHKNRIAENNLACRKTEHVAALKQANNNLQKQLDVNEKLKKENSERDQKMTIETDILKNSLDQTRVELENTGKQLESVIIQQKKDAEIRKRLGDDLIDIRKTIYKEEDSLTAKKNKFHESLNKICNKAKRCATQISLDDVKRKTENMIIEGAVRKIREIRNGAEKYKYQISAFRGNSADKTYLDIKEMLMRTIEKLDGIESQKKTEIQFNRREAINFVKNLQDQLEEKVIRNN